MLVSAGIPTGRFSRRARPLLRNFARYSSAKPAPNSDANLAIRAARGDERAFDALVKRHRERIYSFIQRHVEHPDNVPDVMQEVFISLWRNLPRYDPRRSFKQWLDYIALNKCRDTARRAASRRRMLAAFDPVTSCAPTPEELLLKDEAIGRLRAAIVKLPGSRRDAIILTSFGELSQSEAAVRLGVSVKAIEMLVDRGRQLLAGLVKASDLADLND